MQLAVQVIMIIVCIIIAFIVMYYCCKKCRHTRTLFKYCFPFLPISRILRTSCRTDLFVEVTNLGKGNTVWAHFMAIGYSLQIFIYPDLYCKKVLELKPAVVFLNE